MALGVVLIGFVGKFGPSLPFRSKAPEEVAAETFFQNGDVRSDDNLFERDLKP